MLLAIYKESRVYVKWIGKEVKNCESYSQNLILRKLHVNKRIEQTIQPYNNMSTQSENIEIHIQNQLAAWAA